VFIEDFRNKYTVIPFATFARDYKKNTQSANFEGLSHMHKEMEILLVLDGEAQLHIDTVAHPLRKGDIVVLAPYTLHYYSFASDRDFRHVCLCFDTDLLYDIPLKTDIENRKTVVTPIIHGDKQCAEHIEKAFAAHAGKQAGWECTVIGHISLLFGVWEMQGYLTENPQYNTQTVYEKIFQFISEHYTQDITSADLAATLGFHNSYVCRLFRKSFGECFGQYLCRYRIEKTKSLLQYTDTPISQIALDTGFNSFSYYSQKFKAYTNMTPSEYRKSKRTQQKA